MANVDQGMARVAGLMATADIFAAVEALRAGGVCLLSIRSNDYDNLDVRFEHRTRDACGDASQGRRRRIRPDPSRHTGRRLLLEIVDGRGYRGLGAANAATRLTTQARQAPRPSSAL